jgi:protein-disulfide isomerase
MLFANWNGENQGSLRDKRLIAFAEAIGLDMNAFQACFSENRYKTQIDADLAMGNKWGVNGTPSVFVNGLLIKPGYVPEFTDIQQAVEAALGGK